MKADVTQLLASKQPWLLRAAADTHTIERRLSTSTGSAKTLLRTADGERMRTVVGVLKEIGVALSFPEYYGQNSAAFYECATDLDWLPADGYVFVITNCEHLLKDEPEEFPWLTDILSQVCEAWSEPVNAGEAWDRPAKPFHVVFQYKSDNGPRLDGAVVVLPEIDV